VIDGLRLALTTLTVLPVRAGRIDRRSAAVAMSLAPPVGALLGLILAALLYGLRAAHAPGLLASAVTVTAGVLLTRALHLDGLADTADGLGSYQRGAEALAIMKKSDIGPFGVAAIAVTLLIQAAAVAGVSVAAVVVAYAAGRLAITLTSRRGLPAARPQGLGAMVAETVPVPVAALAAIIVAVAAAFAVPGRWWHGPAAVAASAIVVVALTHHAVRRFGGVTGDVLGAMTEVGTTIALVVLSLKP
jgi:adenosylcobinamide-GDP ribazoletransferase